VIVDASVQDCHFMFERFARNFDVVVVNTLALPNVVQQLAAVDGLDVVWWLHEAQSIAHEAAIKRSAESRRVRLFCNSAYSREYFPAGSHAEVLYYGVPDRRDDVGLASRPEWMTFVVSGTVEPRKGQDIFVKAIALLPAHVRENCRFLITGNLSDPNRLFWEPVQAAMAAMPEINYLGLLAHDDMLDLIARSDVLVCCSRDEPFSLVVMEAAMLGKPSILSTNVGARDVFGPVTACEIFESENAQALAERMFFAYQNREAMARMGEAARKAFEQELTVEAFSERFFQMVLRGGCAKQGNVV
jgi:glycosyltransferase involved in cell wall biosynthesis